MAELVVSCIADSPIIVGFDVAKLVLQAAK
jgi:hypothetical protein